MMKLLTRTKKVVFEDKIRTLYFLVEIEGASFILDRVGPFFVLTLDEIV